MKKYLRINKSIYTFLWLLFSILPGSIFSQVKFSAVSSDKQIGRDDYLQVQYIVENASNVEQIIPPSFKNFSVFRGPIQQSSTSIINGTKSESIALEFILKPNATGTFTLPPATAKVNGKTLLSNSLSVRVTNNTSGSSSAGTSVSPFSNMITEAFPAPSLHQYDDYILRKGENVSDKIKKNLFVKLEVTKTSCYVGEPLVATYKLYTRLKSESNLTKTPSFNGFSVSEMKMPGNYSTAVEKYNGREYSVYILRQVQLYPLQPGSVELDPAEVENHITFIKADYANAKNGDIFYDMMRDFIDASTPAEGMVQQKITLQSKALTITVKPLPELNKPLDFKGITGSFSLSDAIEKNNITTDEAGNLTISISGSGNIQMLNAPTVSWPDGIEAFEPKTTENIDNTAVPLKGQKIFNYPFTVSTPGRYTIPAISFSYFDLATQSYKTLLTTPQVIEVKKGLGIKPASPGKPDVNTIGEAPNSNYATWLWPLIILAFIAALVVVLTRQRHSKNAPVITPITDKKPAQATAPADKQQVIIPQNPLHDAEMILMQGNGDNFYYTLNNGLKKYLSHKLDLQEAELSKKKINELLDKQNVTLGTTLMLSSLMENIDLHLYAPPASANHMQAEYENACEVIALLEKQIISSP